MAPSSPSPHHRAADAFARRIQDRYGEAVELVLLYGSVARGEQRGIASDVDLLVVLSDDAERSTLEDSIREVAYDVELEYGVVLSLVVRSAVEYARERDRPFFRHVHNDAEVLHG